MGLKKKKKLKSVGKKKKDKCSNPETGEKNQEKARL